MQKKFDIRFDFYSLIKADHALISFFDQTFDQGISKAVPYTAYWTPLRYMVLVKLSYLFDEPLLRKAWEARITRNNMVAEAMLVEVCEEVIQRVSVLPDARSREIITDAMTWVIQNPSETGYNIYDKKNGLQISPNLIGFQSVMFSIADTLKRRKAKASSIIVDRQSEFNNAQKYISDFYSSATHINCETGLGLPNFDLRNMPQVPITCTPGTNSVGLEIVDIYIWIFKRFTEKKELAPELLQLIQGQLHRGRYRELSLANIEKEWAEHFSKLPDVTKEQELMINEARQFDDIRRKSHLL